jgi:tetratricopeptide (TPR) repeat protein
MDASNIPKEECCPSVTMSIQFNGINQISSMISVFDCESKPLADEAIRLIRLTQGKWYRPLDNINSNIITRKVTIRFPANANSIRRNIAQNSFKNDIVYDANEKDSVFHKGYLEFMQGKYSLALITFESCISKQPQYIAARYMRANCYIKLNQHNYACDDLEWLVHKNLGGGVIDELYKRYCLDGAVKKNEPIIRNGGFSKFRSK